MPRSTGPAPEEDGEAWIVELARARFPAGSPGAGIGDDAAVLDLGNAVTTDTMVEGVHWDERLSPADVGWKLVAVNVSDLGAMGARPRWATLALTLPRPLDRAWVRDFYAGLADALGHFGVQLVGGDTTRGPARMLSLTVGGAVRRPVLRSGGRPGDELWVTGELGLSAQAFLRAAPGTAALAWFRRPRPPVGFGVALAEAGLATAMMDLSDGLAIDLRRLCRASGCGALVQPDALPGTGTLAERVAFGEDYQLLFAASAEGAHAICCLAEELEVPVSKVGCLTESEAVLLAGEEWPPAAFGHFTVESP
jgi:thiamine-monophosphate kinase